VLDVGFEKLNVGAEVAGVLVAGVPVEVAG
jgi:hypothetical protein